MGMYNRGKKFGKADWEAGTWRVLLVTSSYTPNADHDFVSDVVANEASGAGYSRKDLTTRTATVDDTNDRVDYTADKVLWATLTAAFKYAIVYKFGSNDGDSELHSWYDLGAQSLTALPFDIKWNGIDGVGALVRAA